MRLSVILLFLQLWGNVEVSSSQNVCSTLPDVPHAHVSEETKRAEYQGGHIIHFTCEPGYATSGPTITYVCSSEGWLAVQQGTCYRRQCKKLHINNAQILRNERNSYGHNDNVQYTCSNDGNKRFTVTCEKGDWTGIQTWSAEIKCPVPEIENGYVPGDIQDYKEDDILHFRCNTLYIPAETRSSHCTKQGVKAIWSPTPMCEPITCRLILPPVRGTRYEPASRNVFSPGDTVRVICGANYWISTPQDTSAVLTCKGDGEWNVDPTCQEVKCTSRQPEEVHSWHVDWRYPKKLGDTTSYWCKTGYKRTGGASRATCTRDGWKPDPLCEEIKCKSHPDYDIVGNDQNIYGYNDHVEYICKTGYEGRFILTCTEQGWFGSPQCRERQCKKLHIDNAQILRNKKSYYGHNEKVQYTCSNDGNKRFTITCEKGDWTGIQTCSACPNADVPHGFAVGPYNGTLYYTCDEGYKLYTKGWWAKAKCNDGAWSKIESCIANSTCREIPVIPNGEVTPPRGQSHTARITCNKGYEAQISRLTCLEGEWSADGLSPKQICTPTAVSCSPPPKVENAVVVTSYQEEYVSGSAITYWCRDKYALLQAEDSILCNDGKWEVKNFECTPYCDKLDNRTMTFTADRERYVEGDVIQYHCVTADVDGTATCVNTKWNMSAKCEEKCKVAGLSRNVRLTTHPPGNQLKKGQMLRFACVNPRDTLRGKATVECLADGQWSDQFPTCGAPLDCGSPPPLADGDTKRTLQSLYRHGQRVEYICQNYYLMEGEPYKTCSNGEWIGQMRCLKPCTVDRVTINMHNIIFRYTTDDKLYSEHNDQIQFMCKGRTSHVGTVGMRQTCVDGVLQLPTCQ